MTAEESEPRGSEVDPVVELVAECLARIDESGEPPSDVIEAFCREHPEREAALRERLGHLERAGLATGRTAATGGDGRTLGRFKILGELGRGGMGVVYLVLDPRLGRRVALKALGPRLVISDRARTRFEREIRAIAGLNHPRIVPVYEVGEESGVPWYTMELVEGRTLAQVVQSLRDLHVSTHELSTSHLNQVTFFERTDTDTGLLHDTDSSALLRADTPREEAPSLPSQWGKTYVETVCRMVHDVADALEHAHTHGVVHRDVKPSNVLIDARGRALLFDFGLARLDSEEALTQTGDFAGTPFYVAPEQISGKGKAVDHRADIYALGVTLFELLTLQRPFQGRNTQQVFRQILTKDPPLPRKLNRLVPRDLETICLTALEKEPGRRYQRASDLAADLRRFLEFRPVRARPVGLGTRIARWVKRKPGAATAVALAGVIAVGVPAAVLGTGVRLATEAERTKREAARAARINDFLLEMLGAANPAELGFDATIREAVDLAVERLDAGFEDALLEAGVRATIGTTYLAIGEFEAAELHLRRALELRSSALPGLHPDVTRSLDDLGVCLLHKGSRDDDDARGALTESRELLTQALAALEAQEPANPADLAGALAHLALLAAEEEDFGTARSRIAESQALRRDAFGPESREVAQGLLDEGDMLEREWRADKRDDGPLELAEERYREALALLGRIQGESHPDTSACRNRLAKTLMTQREMPEAEELFLRNSMSYTQRLGARHQLVAQTNANLALARHLLGKNDQAEQGALEALQLQRAILPAGHPHIASTEIVLAQILLDLDLPEDASPLLEDAVRIRRQKYGDRAEATAYAMHRLAKAYYDQVRLEEALEVGEEALSIYAELPRPDREMMGGLQRVLGLAWNGMGRPDLALERLASASEVYVELRGRDNTSTVTYRADLANFYFTQGLWEEAGETYEEVLSSYKRTGIYEERHTVLALSNLSETLAQRGLRNQALDVAEEAIALNEELGSSLPVMIANCHLRIGRILYEDGHHEQALGPLLAGIELGFSFPAVDRRLLLDCARIYGHIHHRMGNYDEAEARLLETQRAQESFLGIQHPDTRMTLEEILRLYGRLEMVEEHGYFEGRLALSYALRDAGAPPYVGTLIDGPIHYRRRY
ncbi:MAG: serine/threonine-protein kinase [Planctomycetota bacterium]